MEVSAPLAVELLRRESKMDRKKYYPLGRDAVYFGTSSWTFRTKVRPPFLGSKSKQPARHREQAQLCFHRMPEDIIQP
jgi:hypothetical protein